MLSVNRVIPRSLQISYASRNSLTGDFKSASKQQGSGNEMAWLVAKGGSGKNLGEAWGSYLTSKGVAAGPAKDRMKAFFRTGVQS
jgi:hypothetical protein